MFVINESLREKMTSNIPEDYTSLQKILCVYGRMCESLEYSMPAYIDGSRFEGYYRNPAKLAEIDGEKRKDVMCYSFAAIFAEIVKGMKMSDVIVYAPMLGRNKMFDPDHTSLNIYVDGNEYNFDPLGGIVDNNDLNNAKIGLPLSGVEVVGVKKGTTKSKVDKALLKDMAFVKSQEPHHVHDFEREIEMLDEYDLSDLDFEQRLNIFLKLLSETREPMSALLLNHIVRLRRKLFLPEEDGRNIDVKFLSDLGTTKKLVFVSSNPSGYKRVKGKENFDDLTVSMFDFHDRKIVHMNRDEAIELERNPNLCIDGMIRSIGRDGRPLPRFRFSMAAEGSEQREGTSGPWVQEIL